MAEHERFSLRTGEELLGRAAELGLELPFEDSVAPLLTPVVIDGKRLPNRLAVQPMEGFDAEADGSPSELALRRYARFARGGSGLIWFEATSVAAEGRSNPRQLWLHEGNLDAFKRLVDATREAATREYGPDHEPYLVLQLTHSGRCSRPESRPAPLVAARNPHLETCDDEPPVVDDDGLERLRDRTLQVARLVQQAGFDAVDIKACHGYLLHELLGAFTRRDSRYGGEALDNRVRLILEILEGVSGAATGLGTTVRLNIYDGLPWPFGFGVSRDGSLAVDLTEPLEVARRFQSAGVSFVNVTMGIPTYNPHVGRPFDRVLPGAAEPPEHPLEGVARLLHHAGRVQKALPELLVVGTGYSWLRQHFPNVAAGVLARGEASLVGLGRSSFAYPDAPRDLMAHAKLEPTKVCVTCSGCTELMRGGSVSGCITRDRPIYKTHYKEIRKQ